MDRYWQIRFCLVFLLTLIFLSLFFQIQPQVFSYSSKKMRFIIIIIIYFVIKKKNITTLVNKTEKIPKIYSLMC